MPEAKELEVIGRVGSPDATSAEILAVGLYKSEQISMSADVQAVDARAGGRIKEALDAGDFKGDMNETRLLYAPPGLPWKRILLVGLGPQKEYTLDKARQAAGTAGRRARDLGVKEGASLLLGEKPAGAKYEDWVQAQVEGPILSTHQFLEFRTTDLEKVKQLDSWTLIETQSESAGLFNEAVERGATLARAANYTRWLGGLPGNHATPSFLASQAQEIAREQGYGCTVLEPDALREMGMGALLSVARGSDEPCRFILLEAKVSEDAPWIGVVGKGVTFDSGGISLKPSSPMWEMKYDMCGAAAVLGLFKGLKAVEPKVNVVGAIPTTENLPGGKAQKPGDIWRSFSGKTIEVLNTDAEGRLILADALTYVARNYKPVALVDLATLTGACVIALGHYAAGLLSKDDALAGRIEAAAESTGEKVWRLPLWDEYKDHLKTPFADIKNIGDSNAGAGTITAGTFLGEFVEASPWAHLDIAGAAWWDRERPYIPKGPSGYGVRLLAEMIRSWER